MPSGTSKIGQFLQKWPLTRSVISFWNRLKTREKTSFLILIFLILIIPAIVAATLIVQQILSRADQPAGTAESSNFANSVPLSISGTISGFTVDGDAVLYSDNAFVRVILIDKSGGEYLVYETYSAISDTKTSTVKNTCDETCVLDSVAPDHLRIEGNSAKFTIAKTSFVQSELQKISQKSPRDLKIEKDNAKISKLNEIIKKKGLKWTAGETSVSKLTYAQKKKLFANKDGILPNLQGLEYYKGGIFEVKRSLAVAGGGEPTPVTPPVTPPSSPTPNPTPQPVSYLTVNWDWRNRNGVNWVSPIKDQLGCGSCWAFAAISTTESAINLYYNQVLNIDLSEQDSVCKHPGSCANGGYWSDTLNELATDGLVTESCYPYTGTETCPGRCANAPSELWKITTSNYAGGNSSDEAIKKYLITKGPVPFGVPEWWHIMTLVGYEREEISGRTVWIVKNSWGTSWGENGYGKLVFNETYQRYIGSSIEKPYPAANPNLYKISCKDNDHDHYCNWGISETKPLGCPAGCLPQKDCNDSNPNVGPFDSGYNCSPIATPAPLSPPVISTTSLPAGNKGKLYQTAIVVYDVNMSDRITLSASGFPSTIKQQTCAVMTASDRSILSCVYSGTPKATGTYAVKVTARDNTGRTSSKIFTLKITK